jgi:alkylation response protein AidB-like acyl-CoA dehydrogenase
MDFAFSAEQEQLRDVARKYFRAKSPESEVRRLMASTVGHDDAFWKDMAHQLGLQGIAIPEAHGGSGFGFLEISVVMEEMGRALVCAPYFSTVVLAAQMLLEAGDEEACAAYLPQIASGDLVATVALPAGTGDRSDVVAAADGERVLLYGVADYVIDGQSADLVLVVARRSARDRDVALFAVPNAQSLSQEVLSRTPLETLDHTRKLARIQFRSTPAELVTTTRPVPELLDIVSAKAAVALACESVGVCQWGVAESAEYAKMRWQFGRLIGSFQAIKHKCVDMLVQLEAARVLAYYAAWTAETDAPDLALMSSLAKAECAEAAREVAAETLHVHGGIGFTWKHPAHLYLRRAQSSELLLGGARHHRDLVCQRLGL